jgi:hypothetical protein
VVFPASCVLTGDLPVKTQQKTPLLMEQPLREAVQESNFKGAIKYIKRSSQRGRSSFIFPSL